SLSKLVGMQHLLLPAPDGKYGPGEERSMRPFADFLPDLPDGILHLESDSRIKFANRAMAALLGRPFEAMPGLSLLNLVHPDDRLTFGSSQDRCLNGEAIRAEIRLLRQDSGYVCVEWSGNPVRSAE